MKKNLFYFLLISFSGFGFFWAVNYAQENNSSPVSFYEYQKGIYIVQIDTEKCPDCIIPYVAEDLQTVKDIAVQENAFAAINAGYFDTVNHKTASYVVKDGKTIANPEDNENLMQNPSLSKYLPQILNRAEFRVLNCLLNTGKTIKYYDIALHNENPMKCEIEHSIQAGPILLSEMDLEKEAFIVRQNGKVIKESAGVLHKYARSAVAVKGSKVLLIAVGNESKMTITELKELVKKLGAEKAMAFDGGSSTSLFVNLPEMPFELNSAKDNQARRIKSALLVKFSSDN